MDLAENRRAASGTTLNTVNDAALDRKLTFKTMHHLSTAFQRSMVY